MLSSLVLNSNQTLSKYIKYSRYRMESEVAESVAISATFTIILNDLFVLMQLIYESGELQKTFVLECLHETRNEIYPK